MPAWLTHVPKVLEISRQGDKEFARFSQFAPRVHSWSLLTVNGNILIIVPATRVTEGFHN